MRLLLLPFLLLLLPATSFAYFNITSLTTQVYLGNTTTAHVVETMNLYISNASIAQYLQYRTSVNQTLDNWQKAIGTDLLMEHVFNPKGSISNFTFLPGPITMSGSDGYAQLTMSYFAHNVTNISVIAPRKMEYSFNSTAFNFQHTANGQALFPNSKLVIVIPNGAQVVSIYPLPDFPTGDYTNATSFSWYESEPLNKFSFSYVITASLLEEVVNFFMGTYAAYKLIVYITMVAIVVLIVAYLYFKVTA